MKLSAEQHTAMVQLLTESLNGISDEAQATKLSEQFEAVAKQLSESGVTNAPVIQLTGSSLTEDDVKRILSEQATAATAAEQAKKEKLATKVKLFTDAIDKAEGLSDDVKKELKEASALISVDMSDEQITNWLRIRSRMVTRRWFLSS